MLKASFKNIHAGMKMNIDTKGTNYHYNYFINTGVIEQSMYISTICLFTGIIKIFTYV